MVITVGYDLYQQGPDVYIPVLLVSLAITILAYGAFPFIFAKIRKSPITKKKYKQFCYGINAAVMFVFLAIGGGVSNGAPYLLWTWVFSRYGIKELGQRGIMQDSDHYSRTNYRFECTTCGYKDTISLDVCPKCGAYNYKQLASTTKFKESKPIAATTSSEPNIDDMSPREAAEYLVALQMNESHPPQSSATNTAIVQPIGMAWYKFLIYFGLIAGAILNLLYGFNYISGGIYFVETNGEVSAEQVYAYYGTGLKVVDVLCGFFLIAFAILAFVVRHKLANYEPDSLKFVKIFYSLSAGVSFLYAILVSAITGQTLAVQAVTSAIVGLVFLLLNVKYFNKRAHLFVDKTVVTQSTKSTIMFCRKCGSKLLPDSSFCSNCGTKVI